MASRSSLVPFVLGITTLILIQLGASIRLRPREISVRHALDAGQIYGSDLSNATGPLEDRHWPVTPFALEISKDPPIMMTYMAINERSSHKDDITEEVRAFIESFAGNIRNKYGDGDKLLPRLVRGDEIRPDLGNKWVITYERRIFSSSRLTASVR